ncbi:MAG: Co2+/Mg2+ efflux protein ApaG [Crocinitomicaceae bacterium]|jgi:ApaG protein|nr:Co2+/Mg2+ efflux protein ApaG [Crocinitomicaceae bacterium]MDP4761762.1 Co2+/Mg2+ efflux protein ApaG [Crocinitomicaceae bacterium]
MRNKIISSVKIHVKTWFRSDLSNPEKNQYFYNYRIYIENKGNEPIQLLHRHWMVEQLIYGIQHVDGPGVVGEQPLIHPGERYEYVSGCEFWMPIGRMSGFYSFQNLETEQLFSVPIPLFTLEFPPLLS